MTTNSSVTPVAKGRRGLCAAYQQVVRTGRRDVLIKCVRCKTTSAGVVKAGALVECGIRYEGDRPRHEGCGGNLKAFDW